MDAFFVQESSEMFRPTEWTRGPWDMSFQHGGPPAALLGHVVDRDPEKLVAQISLDILRPVPLTPLTVKTNVVRPGKRVELIEAALISDGHPVMRAKAWRIRTEEIELPTNELPTEHPGPDEGRPPSAYFTDRDENDYLRAMEWRFVKGDFLEPGPSTAWLRMRIPLIDGQDPTPLSRVMIAADSASGVSSELNPVEWLFINPDLNVALDRMPEGEWVCLDARTTVQPHGVGIALSRLYDLRGQIGSTSQSLLIQPGGIKS